MACQKCGSIIQNGLSVCPVCGADLTIQSNYKQNNNQQIVQTNSNNVSTNVTESVVVSEKKKNVVLIVIIILLSIVAIIGVLIVSGTVNFGESNNDNELKDIKTINEEKSTTTSSTTKKTTNTTSKVEKTINGGEDVTLHGLTFTIPNGFIFGPSDESEEEKIKYDYYLMRKEADALINMGFILSNISYEEVLSNVIADYEYDSGDEVTTDEEIKTYNNYNYYKIIRKEKLSMGKYKEHTIILIKVDEGLYMRVSLYEPTIFGEQNYLQILTKFIDSKK